MGRNPQNIETFGVKKLDFLNSIEKMHDHEDQQSLEEMIGYESGEEEQNFNKNFEIMKCNNSKPFSANNVSRNENIAISKQIKTEYTIFPSKQQNNGSKIPEKNTKKESETVSNKPSQRNRTPPKSQNDKRTTKRAPSHDPKPKPTQPQKAEENLRNSKFKAKLLEDIEISKKMSKVPETIIDHSKNPIKNPVIKTPKNAAKPLSTDKKERRPNSELSHVRL